MQFRIDHSAHRASNSILVYRPEEYSFDVEPAPSRSFTSVLVDDLNLEIDEAGKVVSVWGICPHTRWVEATLTPPEAAWGEIVFVPDAPLSRGISVRLNRGKYLPVQVDRNSGWVRVQGRGVPASSVKLLPGIIIEITEQAQFCSLWLGPQQGLSSLSRGSNDTQRARI